MGLTDISDADVRGLAASVQYFEIVLILIAILATRKFNISRSARFLMKPANFLPYLLLVVASFISLFNGRLEGLETNLKPLGVVLLILIIDSDRLDPKIYTSLIKIAMVFLILEYLLYYSGAFGEKSHLTRNFGLIRPHGLFLDVQLSSFFICVGLFALGHRVLAGFLSIVMGSLTTTLVIVFLYATSRFNFRFLLIFLPFLLAAYITADLAGTLSADATSKSITYVYLELLTSDYLDLANSSCYVFGCSSNVNTSVEDYIIADVGFFRVAYQYGLIWMVLFLYIVRRYNKRYLIAHLIPLLHYAVTFGALGIVLFLMSLKYVESLEARSGTQSRGAKRSRQPMQGSTKGLSAEPGTA